MMYPSAVPPSRLGTPMRHRERHRRHWTSHRHETHRHHHARHCGCGCAEHREHDCGCHGHHDEPCRCHDCAKASCECFCCIGDVDIVVYTRMGEQRVVPLEVENERRRESKIRLELSNWTTRSGNPAPVETVSLEPAEFTIEPCEKKRVTLVLKVDPVPTDKANPAGAKAKPPAAKAGGDQGAELPADVDNCLVVTADLRLEGCEHRPVRIAAAILPRYCEPVRVGCGCGCC